MKQPKISHDCITNAARGAFLNKSAEVNLGAISSQVSKYRLPQPIFITQPSLPELEDYTSILKKIWQSKWLTNNGVYHQQLENELSKFLGVKYLSLFTNGTLALLIGIKALGLTGEVITTPFTFPATANVLHWLGLSPVFCDIEEHTLNINPANIERLITPNTCAILGVHIYGNPCHVYDIQQIAEKHNLKIIYDAAHAFGVKLEGKPLVLYGDISVLSFHATKLFTTLEGGALIVNDEKMKSEVDHLKNFGIADEETVLCPGLNAKLNEFQAAFGLLQLKMVGSEIEKRRKIALLYKKKLSDIPGLKNVEVNQKVQYNYSYFPILVNKEKYGLSRDQLYSCLKLFNVHTRKYFYPLLSSYPFFKNLASSNPPNLSVAVRISEEVLCLPIYGNLSLEYVEKICEILDFLNQQYSKRKTYRNSHLT